MQRANGFVFLCGLLAQFSHEHCMAFLVGCLRSTLRLAQDPDSGDSVIAGVQSAALGEYVAAEILELSGNATRDRGDTVIELGDLVLAVKCDEELVRAGPHRGGAVHLLGHPRSAPAISGVIHALSLPLCLVWCSQRALCCRMCPEKVGVASVEAAFGAEEEVVGAGLTAVSTAAVAADPPAITPVDPAKAASGMPQAQASASSAAHGGESVCFMSLATPRSDASAGVRVCRGREGVCGQWPGR
jgi:hypothetical protein